MELFATPSGTRALRTHRTLMRVALGASVFAWLLIFSALLPSFGFDRALFAVILLYALAQMLAFVLTPLSAPALRFGVRRALAFGTLAAAFMFTALALMFAPANPFSFFTLASAFVVFSALHRALYWVPYESVAPHTPRIALPEFSLMFIPIIGGLFLAFGSGGALFSSAALCALCALIPLIRVSERVEAFEWGVRETLAALFARKNRTILWQGVLDGLQGTALLLLWPIAIFVIIRGEWFVFGLILSLTALLTFFLRSHIQCVLKRIRADRSDALLALIAFGAWGARVIAPAPFAIVSADVIASTTISPKRFSIDGQASEQLADGGHFIDEYTALKEMALHLGRLIACALCIFFLSFSASFALAIPLLIAGVASAVSVILARRAARAI